MFIKTAPRKNGGLSIRVVESYWDGKGSRHRTLLSFGSGTTPKEIKNLKAKAQRAIINLQQARQPALPGMKREIYGSTKLRGRPRKTQSRRASKASKRSPLLSDIHETGRVIEGIVSVCGALYEQCGFQDIIQGAGKDEDNREWNEYLKACVISRISDPCSKRRTAQILARDFAQKIPLKKIYRMMDHLFDCRERVEEKVLGNTLALFRQQIDVLLFDVTTLYFESAAVDELRAFGFSKDCKFKEVQAVLALIANQEGHPLGYKLFPGNTSEGAVLIKTMKNLKKKFAVRKAAVVADRAMFSEKNLQFMDEAGLEYVVAAKLRALPKDLKEDILSSGLNRFHLKRIKEEEKEAKGQEGQEGPKEKAKTLKNHEKEEREAKREEEKIEGQALDLKHKGRRLIAHWSRKRAEKDEKNRKRLIQRLMAKIKDDKAPVQKLIPNYGTKKYIKIDKGSKAVLDKDKVEQEARWDGFHGIVTNVRGERAEALLGRYRELWRIEEAFRVNKHTLKMRPIYHWLPRRVHAHILICFLAYSLSFTMRKRLNSAGLNLSIERIRDILQRDQYSVVEDQKTGQRYRIPSKWTKPLQEIYEAFGLKRVSKVTAL